MKIGLIITVVCLVVKFLGVAPTWLTWAYCFIPFGVLFFLRFLYEYGKAKQKRESEKAKK